MKIKSILSSLLCGVTLVALVGCSGCTTSNPNAGQPVYNPATGLTNIEPSVIVDTNKIQQIQNQLNNVLNTASQLNTQTANLNPYSSQIATGITTVQAVAVGVPTVIAAISSLVAFFQNKGKKVQTAAAAQLAKSTTNEQAIANASTPEVAAAIAVHSANAQEVQPVPTNTNKLG